MASVYPENLKRGDKTVIDGRNIIVSSAKRQDPANSKAKDRVIIVDLVSGGSVSVPADKKVKKVENF